VWVRPFFFGLVLQNFFDGLVFFLTGRGCGRAGRAVVCRFFRLAKRAVSTWDRWEGSGEGVVCRSRCLPLSQVQVNAARKGKRA
jgi:hypothetical protein